MNGAASGDANIPLMFNSQGSQIQSAEIVLPLNSVLMPNLSQYFWQAYCKSQSAGEVLQPSYTDIELTETAVLHFFVCFASPTKVCMCRARADVVLKR